MIQHISVTIFKIFRNIYKEINFFFNQIICKIIFYCQNVSFHNFSTNGLPYVSVALGGACTIGNNFKMNNSYRGNPIGRSNKCILFVDKGAQLIIGSNVGMSQAAIVCHYKITIGDNVKIGGSVCIYDTDFHSIDPKIRINPVQDKNHRVKKAVIIKNNVFIGAHSTVLKGVTIGDNSVIGACSVVTKDVPDNEVWAGNPAKKIKSLV